MCYRVLEYVICSEILHHLEKYNIIYDQQHGVFSGCSSETQLFITIHDFVNNLNSQKQPDTSATLLDFTKSV